MITRRIIPRHLARPVVEMAKPGEPSCRRTIRLDGTVYYCNRKVRFDGEHDGIHDAFREHGDGGAIRW